MKSFYKTYFPENNYKFDVFCIYSQPGPTSNSDSFCTSVIAPAIPCSQQFKLVEWPKKLPRLSSKYVLEAIVRDHARSQITMAETFQNIIWIFESLLPYVEYCSYCEDKNYCSWSVNVGVVSITGTLKYVLSHFEWGIQQSSVQVVGLSFTDGATSKILMEILEYLVKLTAGIGHSICF